jgi:hypothetical protein
MHFAHVNIFLFALVSHGLMLEPDLNADPINALARVKRRSFLTLLDGSETVSTVLQGVSHAASLVVASSTAPSTASTIPSSVLASATASSISIDLNHGVEDAWFPGGPSLGDSSALPFKLGCKNCSTSGTVTLTQSEWQFLDTSEWINAQNLTDVIDAGEIRLSIEEFVAHLELQMEPSLQGSITLPLIVIPVFAFIVSRC